jgi:hypothetical protein
MVYNILNDTTRVVNNNSKLSFIATIDEHAQWNFR